MTRYLSLLLAAVFGLGLGCGGSVSDQSDSSGGAGGTSAASGGNAGSAGTAFDCTTLDQPGCAAEAACASVWRNDIIVEMAGPPPPAIGGAPEDPCCIGCEQTECVSCHQPRFVGCRLRSSACKWTEAELCGYLDGDSCPE